ncbi:hypothetical protein ABIB40_004179 [Pedobacter sp. UYP30]|uniref:HEAT repeat domain-containing protein n=1 Tax=Pedobacter sp. UYP30 TaxID=1756400 RepID=UPI0033976E0C
MTLIELKLEYFALQKNYDEVKMINFIDKLSSTNELQFLEFHYQLLKNRQNIYLFYEIRGAFERHGDSGKSFLLGKITTEQNSDLKAEALFILGTMDCAEVKPIAVNFLKSESFRDQYYGIIVIGWLGKSEDIPLLENELTKNKNSELRAYAATALRQISFSNARLNKKIAAVYLLAFNSETDETVLRTIIVCFQDLIKMKFGLRETQTGEVTGNLSLALPKFEKALKNYLN